MRVELRNGKWSCWLGTCLDHAVRVPHHNGVAYPNYMSCARDEHLQKIETILELTYQIQQLMIEEDLQQPEESN